MYSLVFKSVEDIDLNLKWETPIRFVPFAINSDQSNV